MDSYKKNKSNRLIQHAGAFTANLCTFALGNIIGWTAPASPLLLEGRAGYPVDDEENSLVGSLLALGAALSCVPAGYVAGKFGRKKTLLSLVFFMSVGWGLIIWSTDVKMLYAGRFILGLCSGMICVTAPVYAVEICEKQIRGALGMYYQMMLTGGILFTYAIGGVLDLLWLSIASALVPIIFGIAFIFFPETPVYLLTTGKPEKARESLKFFRGPNYDLEPELIELAEYSRKDGAEEESAWEVFVSKQGVKSLGISIGMLFFQQLSGVNAIIFYTTSIFESSGGILEPKYATIVTGLVMFVTTFFVVFVVDRAGRVILLGSSCLLMAMSTFVLGVYFFLKENNHDVSTVSWLPLVDICVFFVVFSMGYGPLPWAIMPEIIPSRIKSLSTSIACSVKWTCLFLVTKFFSDLERAFGSGVTFWIFSGITIIGTVFSFRAVPETKGKSFEEIQRRLGGEK